MIMKELRTSSVHMLKSIFRSFVIFILSLLILKVYKFYFNASELDVAIFDLLNSNILILLYIYIISTISFYFYHSDKSYIGKKKSKASLKVFSFISEFIHISSVVICINAVLINNFLYFEFHNSVEIMYIGVAFSSISIAIFISSKISLGKNYSPCYDQRIPDKIITDGIYRFIRHPIYLSNILLLLGVFIISGSFLIIGNLLILIIFYTISAFREEKYLISKFPNYKNYSKKTGMFVPRYWK